ncbi:MAG: hypothetical protein WC729_10880 [Sphingomonas sp.]|jgi:hypothetical protein|uniref:hypothetical protein n=1 Tax=Sphingomonas sp. TaxID=28214 RepID=UPI003567D05A
MRAIIVAVAAAALPLIATGAAAADDTAKQRETYATAACVVEQEPTMVKALLRTLPGSSDESSVAADLGEIYTACSGDKYALTISRWSQSLYNGRPAMAAAAATAAADERGTNVARLSEASAWYSYAITGKRPGSGYDAVSLGMQEFGTCVVKAAPDGALQLVRSKAGSAEETQALAAIRPALPGCVVQGKPISMKRDQLRLMIAEPLYHAIVDGPAAGRRS